FLMLFLFFVLGTACTKLGGKRKEALGIAQEKGGRRGAKNALANTTAGVVFAFLMVATRFDTPFALALVAAFATAAADTVSSEIGRRTAARRTWSRASAASPPAPTAPSRSRARSPASRPRPSSRSSPPRRTSSRPRVRGS